MEKKKVLWIEPDDDDFELVDNFTKQLNIKADVIRYKDLPSALNDLQTLLPTELPAAIITEYNRFWTEDLIRLQSLITTNKDSKLPAILFTSSQNPKIEEILPHFKVIRKPFDYKEYEHMIEQIVQFANVNAA